MPEENQDESSVWQYCRVACGAEAVIRHELPYLLLSAVSSHLDEESDLESNLETYADDDDEEKEATLNSNDADRRDA